MAYAVASWPGACGEGLPDEKPGGTLAGGAGSSPGTALDSPRYARARPTADTATPAVGLDRGRSCGARFSSKRLVSPGHRVAAAGDEIHDRGAREDFL